MSLADSTARGVHHAKDLERNAQTLFSARRVSSRVPGLMGGSCHSQASLRPRVVTVCALHPEGGAVQAQSRGRRGGHRLERRSFCCSERGPPGQLSRLRGGSRSSATRTPLASACNVRTDKLKRGHLDGGAEQAKLKVVTCCEVGASNPSLI